MKHTKMARRLPRVLALSGLAAHAVAAGIDDPRRADYFKTFEGKTIAFVPVTMGIDLTEGWASVMKKQADRLGMKFEIRDPHFSADAGAQAITSLIAEKPDVLVVHNPDVQSYAKLLKRAEEAGIHVVQINMRSNYNSDVYVGADWIGIGEAEAQAIVDKCGAGTSGKVAILQGQPTSGSDSGMMKGADNVFSKHPEIKVVANQAGRMGRDQGALRHIDRDSTKSRSLRRGRILGRHGSRRGRGDQGIGQADRARHVRRRRADGLRQCREGRVREGDRLSRHGSGTRPERHDRDRAGIRAASPAS